MLATFRHQLAAHGHFRMNGKDGITPFFLSLLKSGIQVMLAKALLRN